jgi:CDP-glycerol glycerophosphotransferase (TagB/SpsB family)/glycosyltransferase involved in cell wall biosynthesis
VPRFSVIVPVHKVQAYLHACLDSVLEQSYGDFEVIVVDDCSPDGSGEIADAFAGRDARVRVLHLPENVGLGRARNAGMAEASGDYLLFLDGDDEFTPGTLAAVAARLERTGDPDLLVFDYERTYWDGRAERNQFAAILTRAGRGVFTLADRPELLRLLMVAWNKAYRRDFVRGVPLTFPAGWYEDTPWTFPALLTAGSITALDRVCVRYRQRRRGSILRTTSRRHFDVFGQYDLLFAFLDSHPELDRWRPALFRRILDHLIAVHTHPDRLPPRSRPEFFRRCRVQYARLRPPGFRPAPFGRRGLRHLLVALGARRTFAVLGAFGRLRPRTARGAAVWLGRLHAAALRTHYRLQRRRRLDPDLAVFRTDGHRGYECDPAAVEGAVRELVPRVRSAWITTAGHAHTLPPGVARVEPGSARYWTVLARATYLVGDGDLHRRYVKRPGQVHVQTHRGTPLKHMGTDLVNRPAVAGGTDFAGLLAHADHWDFSLSANRHATLVWERAYPSSYTTLEYGQPRTDVFHRTGPEQVRAVRAGLGVPPGTTVFLYAPTHRDHLRGYVPLLDPAALAAALGPDTLVMLRTHYRYAGGARQAPAGPGVLDVSRHPSVAELCLASDALITDYSSLMFDYAGLDRPIVLYVPDWEVYRAVRGTYFDVTAHPPGPVARGQDDLTEILRAGTWRDAESDGLRAAFRERFCPYDNGHAAERVVRHVFLREDGGLPPVTPIAERRPAPAPSARVAQGTQGTQGTRVSAPGTAHQG